MQTQSADKYIVITVYFQKNEKFVDCRGFEELPFAITQVFDILVDFKIKTQQ